MRRLIFPVTAIKITTGKTLEVNLEVTPPIKATCPNCQRSFFESLRGDLQIDWHLLLKGWLAHCDRYGCDDRLRPVLMCRVVNAK